MAQVLLYVLSCAGTVVNGNTDAVGGVGVVVHIGKLTLQYHCFLLLLFLFLFFLFFYSEEKKLRI